MKRALATVAFVLCACANGHHVDETADSATDDATEPAIDSPEGTIDSPPGTIDSPPGTPDSPPGTPDSPPGTPDAPPPDAMTDANNCPTQPCTLSPQCGCPTGQSCDVDPTDLMGNVCRAVNTPGRETNTCGSFSECDVGYVCLGDGTNDNCHKYCVSNADCAGPRGQCVIQLTDGNSAPIPGAVTCSSNCDPSTNSASAYCPASWKCGLFSATYQGTAHDITDCEIAGTGTQGTSCTVAGAGDDTKCAQNYTCATLNGTAFSCGKVVKYLTGSCPGSTQLYEFNPALSIGGTEYGVCL